MPPLAVISTFANSPAFVILLKALALTVSGVPPPATVAKSGEPAFRRILFFVSPFTVCIRGDYAHLLTLL